MEISDSCNFRDLFMTMRVLWIPLVFVAALSANPVASCTAGATSVPAFSISSTSGEVGDYTLDCSGTPPPPGMPVPTVNVDAFLNVPILNTGGWTLVDGASDISGTLKTANVVEFDNVPFDLPTTGTLHLTVEGIFVNPSDEGPGFSFQEIDDITTDFSVSINNQQQEVAVNAVPEPSALLVTGLCLLGVLWRSRSAIGSHFRWNN